MNKNLLTLAFILILANCSSDDEAKPVTGKSFFKNQTQKVDEKEVDAMVQGFFSKLPLATKNSYWPRNGYIPGENLAMSEGFDYKTSSAGSEPKKGIGITSTPIIAEDKIFTLGGNGELQARNINDISEVLWEKTIEEITKTDDDYVSKAKYIFGGKNEFIGGNICYSLGNIFVTTKRGNIFNISTKDGKTIWTKNYGAIIRSTPVVRDEKLIFVTSDNRTIAVNSKDGSILWTHQGLLETSKVMSSPAPLLIGNKVIVTYSSGEIFALDFNSGTEVWTTESHQSSFGALSAFMSDISYNPVFHKGLIYVVSSDGTLNAIDEEGKTLWSFEGEVINSSVWPVDDFLFTKTRFGDLIAISAREGKLIWKNKMAGSKEINEDDLSFTGVIMANGKLFAADNDGSLYAYSSKNGETLNKYSIPSNVILTPVVAGSRMFLLTKDSTLIEIK